MTKQTGQLPFSGTSGITNKVEHSLHLTPYHSKSKIKLLKEHTILENDTIQAQISQSVTQSLKKHQKPP